MLDELRIPIVQAPLAGGASTPELAAAVSNTGALGFVAAGYKTAEAMVENIAATRELTDAPFGVNVFAATPTEAAASEIDAYTARIRPTAEDLDVELGEPQSNDDHFDAKLEALLDDPVPIVSFTFGCPSGELIEQLKSGGSEVWVTVTNSEEAKTAGDSGAQALVAQGAEAGGHRATFDDSDDGADFALLPLLQLLSAETKLPLVATGGIATGRGVAAVLCAGATAAQLGSAFMRCPEAGTASVHREALSRPARTALTRAFSGRTARGIVNKFLTENSSEAPAAYPAVHYLTAPIRAKAREVGDEDALHLWAGQAHELATELPAAQLVRQLEADAREALDSARACL